MRVNTIQAVFGALLGAWLGTCALQKAGIVQVVLVPVGLGAIMWLLGSCSDPPTSDAEKQKRPWILGCTSLAALLYLVLLTASPFRLFVGQEAQRSTVFFVVLVLLAWTSALLAQRQR